MDEQVGVIAGPENENPEVVETQEQVKEPEAQAKEPEGSAQETPKPKRNGFTRKIERQQAEIEALKAQVAAIVPKPVTEAKRPTWDEYAAAGKTSEQYFEDLADFKADQKIQSTLKQREEQQRNDSLKSEQKRLQTDFQKKAAEFAKTVPDFEEVTQGNDIDMSPALAHALLESDHGPALAYHLAKNLDFAEELNGKSYGQIARELGKLEAKLEQPVKTTTAPAPINPVGSKAKGELNAYSKPLSYEEYQEWRAKQS